MSFGLKNARATYQRLVNTMFKDLIGKSREVYVDDMLVKFNILQKYQMKLNPLKCAFGVASGKFLGFMVNQRRIEVNPEKIKVFLEISSPKKPKKVMSLAGRVAALSRFVS